MTGFFASNMRKGIKKQSEAVGFFLKFFLGGG